MMNRTQEQWAIKQLLSTGEVSRNAALQNFITRLGAIICSLNQRGWKIEGTWRKGERGKDFVYKLVESPLKKVSYFVPDLGRTITAYEK